MIAQTMSREQLQDGIVAISEADDWNEARLEWVLHTIWKSDDPEMCLCGHHPIKEICVIENKINHNQTEVGNCCVNNFLGLSSENAFASLRRVSADEDASFNEQAIRLAHKLEIISDWERKFYLNIWRKRNLSAKQYEIKINLNRKMLKAWTR